ncbi:hypothetical protein, partial [cf. Phormidesmis sp. LEGE 11477]|uniref:hypothetical protein n=1 Tax=cf. Phormidesmis sp. LEGE 11477 TaxID=1828680 RepID=UPI001D14E7F3
MKIVTAPFRWFISGFSGKTSWEWLECEIALSHAVLPLLLLSPGGRAVWCWLVPKRCHTFRNYVMT